MGKKDDYVITPAELTPAERILYDVIDDGFIEFVIRHFLRVKVGLDMKDVNKLNPIIRNITGEIRYHIVKRLPQ